MAKQKQEQKDTLVIPPVYQAVTAVGTLRPKFGPKDGKIFADELNVIGTAFWLKKSRTLITCAHVIIGLLGAPLEVAGLLVVGNAGSYKRAVVEVIDQAHDLATLRLIGDDNLPLSGQTLEAESAAGLEIVESYAEVSTSVAYAGFPLGNQLLDKIHSPTYSEGVVGLKKREDELKKEIQISGNVVGGFSGSPVVIKDDPSKVLGVVSNGPAINGASSGIFMAISWEHVKAIAELANS